MLFRILASALVLVLLVAVGIVTDQFSSVDAPNKAPVQSTPSDTSSDFKDLKI